MTLAKSPGDCGWAGSFLTRSRMIGTTGSEEKVSDPFPLLGVASYEMATSSTKAVLSPPALSNP
jgi:hypothetical protein